MRAAICEKYGKPDVIKIKEIPIPKVGDTDVLIKVMASAVNSGDVRMRSLNASPIQRLLVRLIMGISRPRNPVFGAALSGEVVALGKDVKSFKVGNQVFAMTGLRLGAHAQYAVVKASKAVAHKPENAKYEEAAVLPFGGTTALHFLKKAGLIKGQVVMIYGASGAVGTAGVQIAKYLGASVTAVCSARHFDIVSALGADKCLDYQNDAYINNDEKYDIIFDCVGKIKKSGVKGLLKPSGRFISVEGYGVASEQKEALVLLAQMYEAGKLKAVIDRSYTLEEIVDAHRYVDQGTKTGNVALLISHE